MNSMNDYLKQAVSSYRPPEPLTAVEMNLRQLATLNNRYYKLRADTIDGIIAEINCIVSSVKGKGDEWAKIRSGDERERQSLRNQVEGRVYKVSTTASEAYRFLNNSSHFIGNDLNRETIDSDIAHLRRKAIESRATAQLFADICSKEEFQRDPEEYIERWRNTLNHPTVAERKVLKRFDSSSFPPFGFRVENREESSSYSFCPLV